MLPSPSPERSGGVLRVVRGAASEGRELDKAECVGISSWDYDARGRSRWFLMGEHASSNARPHPSVARCPLNIDSLKYSPYSMLSAGNARTHSIWAGTKTKTNPQNALDLPYDRKISFAAFRSAIFWVSRSRCSLMRGDSPAMLSSSSARNPITHSWLSTPSGVDGPNRRR